MNDAVYSGSRIVAEGRVQEVMDGLNQGPQTDVIAYWKYNLRTGYVCSGCAGVRNSRGKLLCLFTGELEKGNVKIIKGITKSPRRVLLYGVHGVGKSTWAAQAPKAVLLNIEDGAADIPVDKTPHLTTFVEVMAAVNWFASEEHDYRTLIVDTIDWVEQLIFRDIAQASGVQSVADIDFGKGYPRAIPKWQMFLNALDWLRKSKGMAVILLAHARVEKFTNPEGSSYDRYAPDLWTNSRGEGAGNMIQEWCDEVLFASFRVLTTKEGKGFNERTRAVGGKERYIRTSESASCLAKNRIGLPEELPMEWSAYADHVRNHYAKSKPKAEPSGDIAGIVIDGSSKAADNAREFAEMAEASPF